MQLLYLTGHLLRAVFFEIPRFCWRIYVGCRRAVRNDARARKAGKLRQRIPPQITIDDPTVRAAERIADEYIRLGQTDRRGEHGR